jgi:hypothetical protein
VQSGGVLARRGSEDCSGLIFVTDRKCRWNAELLMPDNCASASIRIASA